jgi:putative DNA primase/helicase
VDHDTEQYERSSGWVRTSEDKPCPLCDKPDGCLYPKGEHDNPNAVICVRIKTGAAKAMRLGWLHIFDPARQALQTQNYSLLMPSEFPILVVEGASDVCAAYDLGFTAIGKPSATSKSKDLIELLSGRQVVILGENDAGAGQAGMESTFAQLQNQCPDCTMLMPPEGVKDLRQWKEKGLTQQDLLTAIEQIGMKTLGPSIFNDDIARTIARNWLDYQWTIDGQLGLRLFEGRYAAFDGCSYELTPKIKVEGSVHDYLEGKKFLHENGDIKPYKATRSKVGDILGSCSSFFPIEQPIPSWIGGGEDRPNPARLITFTNGMLDVDEWIAGRVVMHNHDPRLFNFTQIPYDFDEDLESKLAVDFIKDTFNYDEDSVLLSSQWYGINLVPDRTFEKLMILIGVIRSGKGCMLDMLIKMLGKKNCAVSTYQGLSGEFGREGLLGKLSAVIPDARDVKSHHMQQALEYILMLTGGDAIPVNKKNIPEIPLIYLPCRFTMAMNMLPGFVDNTSALESRTLILKFNNSHWGKEDFTLKTRLSQEAAEGKLVNFALRGLKSLYTDMKFVTPQESAEVLRTFRETVSPITHFIDMCIDIDKAGPGVSIDDLYGLSKWWREDMGFKPMAKNKFVQVLQATMPHAVQILEGEVGNKDRMMMGIKVTDWAMQAWQKG